jgi:methyl-accepting chemotaxis protein
MNELIKLWKESVMDINNFTSVPIVNFSEFGEMTILFNTTMNNLYTKYKNNIENSETIKNISEILSVRIEESSASIETIASAQNDIAQSTSEQMNTILSFKVVFDEIKNRFNQITDSLNKITDNTNSISEIANRTNMLSLNASIEAARAEDHGKGFGVVAQNVRNLSIETSKVAKLNKTILDKITNEIEYLDANIQKSNEKIEFITMKQESIVSNTEESLTSVEEQNSLMVELVQISENLIEISRK